MAFQRFRNSRICGPGDRHTGSSAVIANDCSIVESRGG
jgi:hypothetical protein